MDREVYVIPILRDGWIPINIYSDLGSFKFERVIENHVFNYIVSDLIVLFTTYNEISLHEWRCLLSHHLIGGRKFVVACGQCVDRYGQTWYVTNCCANVVSCRSVARGPKNFSLEITPGITQNHNIGNSTAYDKPAFDDCLSDHGA